MRLENKDIYKYCAVGKIKGLASEIKSIRKRINNCSNDLELISLVYVKKKLGWDARHHMLASAFIKKTPYLLVERKCRADNNPYAGLIFNIVQSFYWGTEKYSLKDVEDWLLDTSITPNAQVKRVKRPFNGIKRFFINLIK